MSNGHVCCILGICCPPGSAAQAATLIDEIWKQRTHLTEAQAREAAERVLAAHGNFADVAALIDQPSAV